MKVFLVKEGKKKRRCKLKKYSKSLPKSLAGASLIPFDETHSSVVALKKVYASGKDIYTPVKRNHTQVKRKYARQLKETIRKWKDIYTPVKRNLIRK